MNYKKDDIVTLLIESMGTEGEGIGKIDGFPFFIKDTVTGDTVTAKVMKVKKNYAFAKLMEIISPSPYRVMPRCPSAKACGGCQIQHVSYEEQLRFKSDKIFNNLNRIGGIPREKLEKVFEPLIGMEDPWRYRNKAQYPIGVDRQGHIIAGFYAGRTHSVIPCDDCMLGPAHHRKILDTVIKWMEKYHIAPYDEEQGQGFIRHILIREGFATGEIMVCLVLNADWEDGCRDIFAGQQELIRSLTRLNGVCSIILNSNCNRTNVILGTKCFTIYGKDYIEDILGSLRFRISPLAFYQVNPVQTEKLYRTVLEFADLGGGEDVWDICCGIGTITLFLAKRAAFVHGLEIVPEAIKDAQVNAKLNHISNVEFIAAAAEEYMPAHCESITADVIVVDPPRKGMDAKSLEVMVRMAPSRIVYVSCDSATLARDVKYLRENGYEVKRVRGVDMFPMTGHVETVVQLSQRKPDDVIEVDLDISELDLTASEAKATYEEIKQYVLEQSGLLVSNLYIAQVKHKCGLDMRLNYNMPKSENAKQPKCPADKEAAIMDALKHFKMI